MTKIQNRDISDPDKINGLKEKNNLHLMSYFKIFLICLT